MKRKIIFTVIGFCIAFAATAQVAGYMGKRFTVGYSLNTWLSVYGPTANSEDNGEAGLNLLHSVDLQYAIKPRTMFCGSLQFFKAGLRHGHTFTSGYTDAYGYSGEEQFEYAPKGNLPMQLSTTAACIGFKFFRHGFIAPVGKYNKFDLTLLFNHVSYQKDAFYYAGVKRSIGLGTYTSTAFALGYSIGRQRVVGNVLVIDYGIRFAIVPNYMFNILGQTFGDDYNPPVDKQFKRYTNERLAGEQLVNFHIGLSFLAF